MKLLPQKEFLKKYRHSEEDFKKSLLKWADLESIYESYLKEMGFLEDAGFSIMNIIRKIDGVHSVKFRIKDPEHLVEKIIRKRLNNPKLEVTVNNYKDQFTDLIGVRALHLFKNDWEYIHEQITATWNLKQDPEINYREGDSNEFLQTYINKNIKQKVHKYGYRSVHYIVETRPAKEIYFAEIQVRTIFEEAWSEIDHTVRYPYDQDNPIYGQFLMILNRLAGSADEMGSFVMYLKNELSIISDEHIKKINKKDAIIKDLRKQIENSKMRNQDKTVIYNNLDQLEFLTNAENNFKKISELKIPVFNKETINDILDSFMYKPEESN